MRKTDDESSTLLLARVASALALRKSLRRHPPIFRKEPFVLVLTVSEELRKDMERAFALLKKSEAALADIEVVSARTGLRGKVDYSEVKATLRIHDRVLVLLEDHLEPPRFLVAAADWIESAQEFDASLLADAVKNAHETVLHLADAERIAAFPIQDVLVALRRGRSHEQVLRRLEAAKQMSVDNVPFLEALSGYGSAAEWGRSLACDVALWREDKIPWTDVDAGLLLSGPPGTGKTLFARSLAKSCGAAFVASSIAQWQAAGHLGDMLGAMRATFGEAAGKAPTVLLLDEFDSVGDRSRFSGGNAQYCTEVVAALLECLDGAFRREGVVVVGACNYPDRVDPALLRPGRLGRHLSIALPDVEARKGILATHMGMVLGTDEACRVAAATEGFSGADIAQLARDARRRARTRGSAATVEDLLAELPPATPIEGSLRDRICVHEAGHVAVGLSLDVGELTGVMVRSSVRGNAAIAGGAVFERGGRLPTGEYYRDSIAMALGGIAAEFIMFGDHLEGSGGRDGSDLQRAADLATTMIAHLGMGGVLNYFAAGSFEELERLRRTNPPISLRVEEILGEELERAKKIVLRNSPFICTLADLLNTEGAVDGRKAVEIFQARGTFDAA